MGSYWIPSNKLKGEGRILYIFTPKSLIYTGVGAVIGLIFYAIFAVANLTTVGYIFIGLFAFLGFGIGTFKVPQIGSSKITQNLAGDSFDDIIRKYIAFKKNKKIYAYSVPRKEPEYSSAASLSFTSLTSSEAINNLKQKAEGTKEGM